MAKVAITFLLILSTPSYLALETDFNNENTGTPSYEEGLWVYDADGNRVELTLEKPTNDQQTNWTDKSKDISFSLYTKQHPGKIEKLVLDDVEGLKKSSFSPEKPTTFITHGWKSHGKTEACLLLVKEFLGKDHNAIVVDWRWRASLTYYLSHKQVGPVGEEVKSMVEFLKANGMAMDKTTLVGHSLGAHVMGLAGFKLRKSVNHVVGLDPAGPLFAGKRPDERISINSGKYVEIVHTNAGFLGLSEDVGHHDFYPNLGTHQPGCGKVSFFSHMRAYKLYAEAITTTIKFWAVKCNSGDHFENGDCDKQVKAIMGERMPVQDGKFYFRTRASSPYSLGSNGHKNEITYDESENATTGNIVYSSTDNYVNFTTRKIPV